MNEGASGRVPVFSLGCGGGGNTSLLKLRYKVNAQGKGMHVTEVIILKAAKTMLKTLDTHQGMPPQATGKHCFGCSSASAPHTGFFESGFKPLRSVLCQETELFANISLSAGINSPERRK